MDIHVVGAAIRDGNKVLAAQRSKDMHMPLKWEFAGGKVETGETHKQALQREISEELDIAIDVDDFVASGISEVDNKHYVLYVYEAGIISGTPAPREHAALKWIEIDRLYELDWADADIPACKELIKKYGGFFC